MKGLALRHALIGINIAAAAKDVVIAHLQDENADLKAAAVDAEQRTDTLARETAAIFSWALDRENERRVAEGMPRRTPTEAWEQVKRHLDILGGT